MTTPSAAEMRADLTDGLRGRPVDGIADLQLVRAIDGVAETRA
jgi:hypothetical protein